MASLVCTLGKWLALQHGCRWADPNGEQRGSTQSSDILKHKPQKICDITTSHTIRQSHLPFNPIVHLMKYCLTNAIYKLTSHLMVRYWIFSPLTAEAMEDITSLTYCSRILIWSFTIKRKRYVSPAFDYKRITVVSISEKIPAMPAKNGNSLMMLTSLITAIHD